MEYSWTSIFVISRPGLQLFYVGTYVVYFFGKNMLNINWGITVLL